MLLVTTKINYANNVTIYENSTNVFIWKLPKNPSLDSLSQIAERMKQLVKEYNLPEYIIVTDSRETETETPKDARNHMKSFLLEMTGLRYVGFSTGRRKFTNMIIRYVMGRTSNCDFSVHKNFEDALQKALEYKELHNI